jgi:glutathione S-transferase
VITLWDNPDSSNARKVRFLLAELGLQYERQTVPMARPRPDDYVALNPLGAIPTLQDRGLTVTESNTILRYLAARERREDLYPERLDERAAVDEFLDRFATRLRTPFFRREAAVLGWSLAKGFDAADADPSQVPTIEAEIAANTELLDRLVGERGAVLGRFTIADCALAPVLQRALDTGYELTPYPRLASLAEFVLGRPAWQTTGPGV